MQIRLILWVGVVQALLTSAAQLSFFPMSQDSTSLVFGGLFSFLNFILLTIIGGKILVGVKKNVALVIGLIVVKYGILIGILMFVPSFKWLQVVPFVVGVLINPMAIVIAGYISVKHSKYLDQRNRSRKNVI